MIQQNRSGQPDFLHPKRARAHSHGGNVQAVSAPDWFPLWVSAAKPGSVHDLTAARRHAFAALYAAAAARLPTLADPGYDWAASASTFPQAAPRRR